MKNTYKSTTTLAVALIALLTSGCVGMALRSLSTDNVSFSEKSKSLGSIPEHHARIWIYNVGGGPDLENTAGLSDLITFNRDIYSFGGDTYYHLDLQAGSYRVTTTNIGIERPFKKPLWKPGDIQKQLVVESGQEYFVRIQTVSSGRFSKFSYPFEFVEKSQAALEMQKLKNYTAWKMDKQLEE